MRILFVTSTRIGDGVLSTGLLHWLEQTYPEARVTIAAGPISAPLFGQYPLLDRMIIMRKQKFSRHWLSLWLATVGYEWDMVIDLRRSALGHGLTVKRHFVIPKDDHLHRLDLNAQTLKLAESPLPKIWVGASHRKNAAKAKKSNRPILAIGPTANWRGKIWPAESFIALIKQLTQAGAPFHDADIAILGAPSEHMQAAPVLKSIPEERRINLVGKFDLLSTAAFLDECAFFIGNDSGLMHIAAAMNCPTLGLFGPSKTELYAPKGANAFSLRTPESFDDLIGQPGYDHRTTESLMGSITVETVFDRVVEIIHQNGKVSL